MNKYHRILRILFGELSENTNNRMIECCTEIEKSIDKHFPEIKIKWKNNFEKRLIMILYLELIHAGFFFEDNNEN